jgi:hypothetical protein
MNISRYCANECAISRNGSSHPSTIRAILDPVSSPFKPASPAHTSSATNPNPHSFPRLTISTLILPPTLYCALVTQTSLLSDSPDLLKRYATPMIQSQSEATQPLQQQDQRWPASKTNGHLLRRTTPGYAGFLRRSSLTCRQ